LGDIYMYDLSINETLTVCERTTSQLTPKIYANKIVWQDNRNGNWDIYLYTNETVNVPIQNQNDIQELLSQYRYVLVIVIVMVAVLVPFVYYKIKMEKLKHEK